MPPMLARTAFNCLFANATPTAKVTPAAKTQTNVTTLCARPSQAPMPAISFASPAPPLQKRNINTKGTANTAHAAAASPKPANPPCQPDQISPESSSGPVSIFGICLVRRSNAAAAKEATITTLH